MRRTGWYRGYQKPRRIGFYERNFDSVPGHNGIHKSYWDGKKFMGVFITNIRSNHQSLPWRGITKESK